jgi:hypothetical protein
VTVEAKLAVNLGDYLPKQLEEKPGLAKTFKLPTPNCHKCYGRGHTGLLNGEYIRCKCTWI